MECKDNYIIYIILILIVLIETLWNVKLSAVLSVSILPEGINRNIVECKAAEPVEKGAAAGSINRNIVECKDFYHF